MMSTPSVSVLQQRPQWAGVEMKLASFGMMLPFQEHLTLSFLKSN